MSLGIRTWWRALTTLFGRDQHRTLIDDELYEAKRHLLEAQSGFEYAKSQVEYNSSRVARLTRAQQLIAETGDFVETAPLESAPTQQSRATGVLREIQ